MFKGANSIELTLTIVCNRYRTSMAPGRRTSVLRGSTTRNNYETFCSSMARTQPCVLFRKSIVHAVCRLSCSIKDR